MKNSFNRGNVKILVLFSILISSFLLLNDYSTSSLQGAPDSTKTSENQTVEESSSASSSLLTVAFRGGPIVFSVLLILIVLSILSWAVFISKLLFLKNTHLKNEEFIQTFWKSRSLNDLNATINKIPTSPMREVFCTGYNEILKCSSIKDSSKMSDQILLSSSMERIERSLYKTKIIEKSKMEKNLSWLSISASTAPFIGLFGTVWGIMGSFEGIALTGSASLAAVAPGISEALTATSFGLAAAIPAVIGYNISNTRIKKIMIQLEGFSSDFLNIIERYFVTDKDKSKDKQPDQAES